ncbi:hypothetical protein C8R44DRAFT_741914 [Mycena epipterygia]|nr:hypothetical protein C8R44DRAFT_741914 [Mycena epipterygia]
MKFITAFLVSFLAVAVATPVGGNVAREVGVEARIQFHCNIAPFLTCKGGTDQDSKCESARRPESTQLFRITSAQGNLSRSTATLEPRFDFGGVEEIVSRSSRIQAILPKGPSAALPAPSKSASPPSPTARLLQIEFAGDKFNLFTFKIGEWIDRPARRFMIRMGSLRQWRQRRTCPGTGEFICQRHDGMHFDVDFLA